MKPPTIQKLKIQFSQDADSVQEHDIDQIIDIELVDAGAGRYFVINTDRWAFDSVEEMAKVLNRVLAMVQEGDDAP